MRLYQMHFMIIVIIIVYVLRYFELVCLIICTDVISENKIKKKQYDVYIISYLFFILYYLHNV